MPSYFAPICLRCKNYHGRKVPLTCEVYKDKIPEKHIKSEEKCPDFKEEEK